MSWAKLDDHFPEHPKVMRAGPDAAWLHVCAICYCARHLTDGFIPKEAVPTVSTLRSPARLALRLVEVGLWHDRGSDYEIHDYLEFNPSRDHVLSEREKAKRRRTSGERRANVVDPVPVPEVLTEPLGRASAPTTNGHRKKGTRIPEVFTISDEMEQWQSATCPLIDLELETTKFVNYWKAKTGRDATKLDWNRTWQNWILKAQQDEARRERPRTFGSRSPGSSRQSGRSP